MGVADGVAVGVPSVPSGVVEPVTCPSLVADAEGVADGVPDCDGGSVTTANVGVPSGTTVVGNGRAVGRERVGGTTGVEDGAISTVGVSSTTLGVSSVGARNPAVVGVDATGGKMPLAPEPGAPVESSAVVVPSAGADEFHDKHGQPDRPSQ